MAQRSDGLEGVVMGATRLSRVDGEAGRLVIAGYPIEELAPAVRFEEALFLLWNDRLPDADELTALRQRLGEHRRLSPAVTTALREAAAVEATPMDALRFGLSALALTEPSPEQVVAALPSMLAHYVRLRSGAQPVEPDPSLHPSADFLRMLRGEMPRDAEARALDTYWVTVSDHGMNASTFTARVIASTGSDLGSAIEGALGALKGPLHGGAPGPALEAFLRLREQGGSMDERTRAWVRDEVAAGRRIMGFGHRVYRVRDPRADVLGAAAHTLLQGSGLYELATEHEQAVLETLRELKPGRVLATNVEFYTALLLHGIGLEPSLFTPVFALGRSAGWTAHVLEQRATGRLIRPRVEYVGELGRSLPSR